MRKFAFLVVLAVAVAMSLATPAPAQQARAALSGVVVDPEGLLLPGVTVTALNDASGITRDTVTAATGRFIFNSLTPGTYTVTFTLASFKTLQRSGVELNVGQEVTLNIAMELGGVEETITVTAETPMVEVKSKELGATVTADAFATLPTQNRSFVMFAAFVPGVSPNPSTESTASDSLYINGQDDNDNAFYVDGAENSDDVIGARAGAQTRTAIEAIQEFQILTSQFDAEFGRTRGGVLNAITKSGSNDFHGVGFYYFQDSGINSKNIFTERAGADNPDVHVDILGGVLGGPIVRDRAHFFVSYERITPNEGITQTFETRPDLDFQTTEETLLRNYLIKGDVQVTNDHKFAVRILREYSPQFNQIIGNQGRDATLDASREEDDTDTSFITSFDSIVGSRGFNTVRFSITREDVSFANPGFNNGGQTFEVQRGLDVSEFRVSVLDGASEVAQSRVNQTYQFDDTFALFVPNMKGDHNMKFGINYSYRTETFSNFGTANGQFTFDTDQAYNPNLLVLAPEFFELRVGGPSGDPADVIPSNNTYGLFFQDDWTLNQNVTLNLGVRWDKEDITHDNNNISPRIGVSWDPTGQGRTVVRAGYGRFFERLQLGGLGWSTFFQDAVLLNGGVFTRFPDSGSDKELFFNIADNSGVTDLNQLRDVLVGMLEGAREGQLLNRFPSVDNPDRVAPYVDTFSVGVQHEIVENVSVGADFVHSENKDVRVQVDLNPQSNALGGRPNISILNGQRLESMGSITSTVNAGSTSYNALQFSLRRRFRDSAIGRYSARISYTYAKQNGDFRAGVGDGGDGAFDESLRFHTRTESGYNFDTGEFIGEPLQLNLDDPRNVDRPSPWHRDHNFVAGYTWLIPKTGIAGSATEGLYFTGAFRYLSGRHYSLQQFDRGDNNQRLLAPAGHYTANIDSDIALEVDFDGKQNGATLPDFARLDFSFRYGIPVHRDWVVTVIADIFNVTNRVNWNNAGSSFITSGAFLIPSSVLAPREFQFGVRFTF
jgi:outer membrane receptor protein involved in Fe transport